MRLRNGVLPGHPLLLPTFSCCKKMWRQHPDSGLANGTQRLKSLLSIHYALRTSENDFMGWKDLPQLNRAPTLSFHLLNAKYCVDGVVKNLCRRTAHNNGYDSLRMRRTRSHHQNIKCNRLRRRCQVYDASISHLEFFAQPLSFGQSGSSGQRNVRLIVSAGLIWDSTMPFYSFRIPHISLCRPYTVFGLYVITSNANGTVSHRSQWIGKSY